MLLLGDDAYIRFLNGTQSLTGFVMRLIVRDKMYEQLYDVSSSTIFIGGITFRYMVLPHAHPGNMPSSLISYVLLFFLSGLKLPLSGFM